MKKSLLFIGFIALILFGCTFVETDEQGPEVDWTIVPEIPTTKDEFLVVPMDALPFAARIPSEWTFVESGVYAMEFDGGASGSVHFNKEPFDETLEEFGKDAGEDSIRYDHLGYEAGGYYSLLCKKSPYGDVHDTYCAIKFDELPDVYFAVISDKALDRVRKDEAEKILFSLYLD